MKSFNEINSKLNLLQLYENGNFFHPEDIIVHMQQAVNLMITGNQSQLFYFWFFS